MNERGDIVGRYQNADGAFHGFLLSGSVAVKTLLDKGLLTRHTQLKLMNDKFENFVARNALSPNAKKWEHPEKGLGWHGMRWILLVGLVAALAFVAGTGESWIKSITAMTTALAGGLETVWKAWNTAHKLISAKAES